MSLSIEQQTNLHRWLVQGEFPSSANSVVWGEATYSNLDALIQEEGRKIFESLGSTDQFLVADIMSRLHTTAPPANTSLSGQEAFDLLKEIAPNVSFVFFENHPLESPAINRQEFQCLLRTALKYAISRNHFTDAEKIIKHLTKDSIDTLLSPDDLETPIDEHILLQGDTASRDYYSSSLQGLLREQYCRNPGNRLMNPSFCF